jgi:hypothetical protein
VLKAKVNHCWLLKTKVKAKVNNFWLLKAKVNHFMANNETNVLQEIRSYGVIMPTIDGFK